MDILSIIPARGRSKEIPKKNIISIGGKPLIAWTIEASIQSKYINRTIVSSDSAEILRISQKLGAETLKRPSYLSTDKSPSEPIISHALAHFQKKEKYRPDIIIFLQPTSPLRNHSHIDGAVALLTKNRKATAVISVYELEHPPHKSLITNSDGYLKGIINNKYPFMRRQDLPAGFMHNGAIYIIKTKSFLRKKRLITNKTLPYLMTETASKQIDNKKDLSEIKHILTQNEKK